MTTFKEDWKKAKTDFTTATQKKKPSASLLGMFNKGTGITSALEDADKAKTAGDLQKAMGSFQKSYEDYTKTLDKAFADPKVTPVADKAAYAEAVKKLKTALQAIHQSAGITMKSLVDAGAKTKDKVDTGDVRAQAEAKKKADEDKVKAEAADKAYTLHVAKRNALAQALTKALAGYAAKGVEGAVANAIKQAAAAKTAKAARDTMGADVAAGAADRFAEQATSLLAEIGNDWKVRSVSPDMIALRLNPPGYELVQPDKKKLGEQAWAATEKVQRDANAYLAKLRSLVVQGTAAAEATSSMRVSGPTPDALLKRIAEIKTRLDGMETSSVFSKLDAKVEGVRRMQKGYAEQPTVTPAMKTQWGQLKGEHENALVQTGHAVKELMETHNRLKAIPQDDQAVVTATAAATQSLMTVRRMAEHYSKEGTMLVKELDAYLAKG